MIDFTGYANFPFPLMMADSDVPLQDYFHTLEDEMQLELLNQSSSYDEFCDIVRKHKEAE